MTTPTKEGYKLVNIHAFPGFYESVLDDQINDEIEQIFNTDDSGCHSHIPEAFYLANVDYSAIHETQAQAYCEAYLDTYSTETGVKLEYEYESYTSPKYYNFETDRLFAWFTDASICALFAESEKDNHAQLAECIKARFTSYDGFLSSYSNDVSEWLIKPVLTWDHNELATLLDAVALVHGFNDDTFDTWDLMGIFQCNDGLFNAVWAAMPEKMQQFADIQREYGQAVDFDLWEETGKAYPDGTNRDDLIAADELPEPRCKHTLELF